MRNFFTYFPEPISRKAENPRLISILNTEATCRNGSSVDFNSQPNTHEALSFPAGAVSLRDGSGGCGAG